MHGGPVAALLARAGERVDAPGPMHPARLTIELLRPVRLVPLTVEARVPSGVGLAESVLYDERGRIGRATQLLLLEPW
jgi:hypothetical protein